MRDWQTIESELILDHPVLRVKKVLRQAAGGRAHQFVVLGSSDWVNVLPITPAGEAVLIRQWRHGIQKVTLEIPGGLVDPGESPREAGAREMMEETGYQADKLLPLGRVRPNPALFDNHCYTFLATNAELKGPARPDETEEIEVITRPVEELPGLVASGEISHSLVISALAFYWVKVSGLAPDDDLL
jgi:8-oxo-dGTP pyrophosphatase MutT (NUDIX family)